MNDQDRVKSWEARLRPLRLDGEPISAQLQFRKRVVWVLTAVASGAMSIVLALFTAFGRPAIGLTLVLLFLGPILSIAWFDFHSLQRRARLYLLEVEPIGVEGTSPKSGWSSP